MTSLNDVIGIRHVDRPVSGMGTPKANKNETIATLPGGWDLAHAIRLGIKPFAGDNSVSGQFGGQFGVLQPIMPLDSPVKVRPWELTVYPRSHIRR